MTYDPDELESQAEEVSSGDFDQTATIDSIETDVAESVFGDDVQGDPTQEMLIVTCDSDAGTEIQEIFSTPKGPLSWRNPNFKLGQFREKYGQVPEEGMEVEITVDENGFLAIDY